MTVSGETIEYYTNLLDVDAATVERVCAPRELAVPPVGIYSFLDSPKLLSRAEHTAIIYIARLCRMVDGQVVNSLADYPELPEPEVLPKGGGFATGVAPYGVKVRLGGTLLVPPSVRTGRFRELYIQAVAPDELDATPRAHVSGPRKTMLPSFRAFYRIVGVTSQRQLVGTVLEVAPHVAKKPGGPVERGFAVTSNSFGPRKLP